MNFSPLSPELEQLVTTLFAESKCACHVINPHKTRILMWKEVKYDKIVYHLRIGIQKFISQEQIDRNGEIYWRYYSPEVKKEVEKSEVSKEEEIPTPSELDPITKFQQRQTKTEQINHDKSNSEPAINSQSS